MAEKAAFPSDPEAVYKQAKTLLWRFDHPMTGDTRELPDEQIKCLKNRSYFCGLASCPICLANYQKSFVYKVLDLSFGKKMVYWLTIAPPGERIENGDLKKGTLATFKERQMRRLRRIFDADSLIFGAVDYGYRIHENKDRHWVPHIHAFVFPGIRSTQKEDLRACFSDPKRSVLSPVQIDKVPISDLVKTAAYTFKCFHTKRSSKELVLADGTTKKSKGLRQRLQRGESMELAYALSEDKVSDLLFLMGDKRVRSSDPFEINLQNSLLG